MASGPIIPHLGGMVRRLIQLFLGLALFGFSTGLMIRAGLGGNPWDVFHQGMALGSGQSLGTVVVVTGIGVLLLWIPLRQRPGIGTICNVFMIGFWADIAMGLIPAAHNLLLAWAMLVSGIVLNGVAGGAYIGAGLGPGPRDGLMTGLMLRTGRSVRLIRTGIELTVVAAGWMLGGTVGIGTALYALAIGPILQIALPFFTISEKAPDLDVASDCFPEPSA